MTRRTFVALAAAAVPAHAFAKSQTRQLREIEIEQGPFKATRDSLSRYQIPDWFRDAKFGIWAHWGPQSAIEAGDWYARNMYMQGSAQYHYHVQTMATRLNSVSKIQSPRGKQRGLSRGN